nr:RNA-directed DNA polymerase, eukaryota [Tanacetum cinerariifolium]
MTLESVQKFMVVSIDYKLMLHMGLKVIVRVYTYVTTRAKKAIHVFENEVPNLSGIRVELHSVRVESRRGLWNVCTPYGRLVGAFIANKRSKAGKRFGFIRYLGVIGVIDYARLWHATLRSNQTSQKQDVIKALKILDEKIVVGYAFIEDRDSRIKLLHEIDKLDNFEAMDSIQKAHIKCDVERDENSKFFHSLINQKRKNSSINGIMHEGVWVTATKSKKVAVWSGGSEKATGPDGYTFAFIERYWDTLKAGILGVHYKIIAKVLANRLSKVVDKIVSHEQIAFITDRQKSWTGLSFLVRPLIGIRKGRKRLLLFKVDFEKAFDSVSWRYLDFILCNLGFGLTWRSWIKACLESTRTSILVNGSPTFEFNVRRGLRQGDPLSLFLFIIIMEGLHVALSDSVRNGLIRGINIDSTDINLNHLFFADDVVITTNWSNHDLENIIRGLAIGSLKSRNLALVHKWEWRLYTNLDSLWVKVIQTLHGREGSFDHNGCKYNDTWWVVALSFAFEKIFGLNWSLSILEVRNFTHLNNMLVEISQIEVSEDMDKCTWSFAYDVMFSVGALHRLSHHLNLTSRGIEIPEISCFSCNGNVESNDRIFFECTFAKEIWKIVRRWCDDSFPLFDSNAHWTDWLFCGPFLKAKSTAYSWSLRLLYGSFDGIVIVSLLTLIP